MSLEESLIEFRNMLEHLTSMKGKSLMVSGPHQKSNHSQIMLKIISVTKKIYAFLYILNAETLKLFLRKSSMVDVRLGSKYFSACYPTYT